MRGRCVGGAWAVHWVLGRLVRAYGMGGREGGLQVGCACPLRGGRMGLVALGGREVFARDGSWERLCTSTCETLCERPCGMSFICVFIGLQVRPAAQVGLTARVGLAVEAGKLGLQPQLWAYNAG